MATPCHLSFFFFQPPSLFSFFTSTAPLAPPPPLLTLYHIMLNTHKSTELPRLHTQTWRSLAPSLPHSGQASQPPSPLPSHTVCLKKNKPVEKTTKDKKHHQAFGIVGFLSFFLSTLCKRSCSTQVFGPSTSFSMKSNHVEIHSK